jgi:hypothetical protein
MSVFNFKNKKISTKEKKFNFNLKQNIKSFYIINSKNNIRYLEFNLAAHFKKRKSIKIYYMAVQEFNNFSNVIINKKYKKLKISIKLRRFLSLIPLIEFKVRFSSFFNFKYNMQKKSDFIIYLNLKFLNEINPIILEFIKDNKESIICNKENFFFLILLDKFLIRNKFEISKNKNSINNYFLKYTQSHLKFYVDCIFINLNHFILDFLAKMKIIIKNIKYNYNFFYSCLKNNIKMHSKFLFFSWSSKLVRETFITFQFSSKLFIKKKNFDFFLKCEYSDEFGTNFFFKKKKKKSTKFNQKLFFYLWGDPQIY